jgi:hypothetical protein
MMRFERILTYLLQFLDGVPDRLYFTFLNRKKKSIPNVKKRNFLLGIYLKRVKIKK